MTAINLFYLIPAVLGFIYMGIILIYTYGWFRMSYFVPPNNAKPTTKAAIIIPARNEENNIVDLLNDLTQQTVWAEFFEIVVVDDNSSDDTVRVVKEFVREHPAHTIRLLIQAASTTDLPFKKKAIERGIENSSGELIVTIDADCRVGKRWLETILAYYEKHKPAMMVGPVSFMNEDSLFEKMQTPEFLSLIAITAGAIQVNKPLMCNGANLAYTREVFNKAGGYGNDRFSSGDDVFLMLRIRKLPGRHPIRFIKSYEALVFTEAKKNVKEFYHQRTRWASKNKGYDLSILFVSVTVYLVNLFLIAGAVYSLFNPEFRGVFLWAALTKALIDLPVVIGISTFVKKQKILLYAFPLVVLYPFYIVITGAMGILGSYQWKDRRIKN